MNSVDDCGVLELREKLQQREDPRSVLDGLNELKARFTSPGGPDMALAYLRDSPVCGELQDIWDFQLSAQNHQVSVHLMSTLAALLRCDSTTGRLAEDDAQTLQRCQESLALVVLKRRMKAIYYHLTSGASDRITAALLIIAAIARRSNSLAKATLLAMDWTLSSLPKIAQPPRHQRNEEFQANKVAHRTGSRPAFVELGLSFFRCLDGDLASMLLQNRVLMGGLLHHLICDSPSTVKPVLAAVLEMLYVSNGQQTHGRDSTIFTDTFLFQLIQLSAFSFAPQQSEALGASALALRLLQLAATDSRHGLCPSPTEDQIEGSLWLSRQSHQIPANRQRFVNLLHNLIQSETAAHVKIVDSVIATSPSIACALLSATVPAPEPECSTRWMSAVVTFGRAIEAASQCLTATVQGCSIAHEWSACLKSLACRVCPAMFPKGYLSRGLQHEHPIVQHCSMALLLRQLNSAMRTLSLLRTLVEDADEYSQLRHRLCQMLRPRLPDIGLLIALSSSGTAMLHSQSPRDGQAMNASQASKALALYCKLFPEIAAGSRFDPSRGLRSQTRRSGCHLHSLFAMKALESGRLSDLAAMNTEAIEELLMLCMTCSGEILGQISRRLLLQMLNACEALGGGVGWQELLLLHLQQVSSMSHSHHLPHIAGFVSQAIASTARRPQDVYCWGVACLNHSGGKSTGALPPLLHVALLRDVFKVLAGSGRSSASRAAIASFVAGFIGQSLQIPPLADQLPLFIAAAFGEVLERLPSEGQPLRSLLFYAALIEVTNAWIPGSWAKHEFHAISMESAASQLELTNTTWADGLRAARSMAFSEAMPSAGQLRGQSAAYILMTSKFEAIARVDMRQLVLQDEAPHDVCWALCSHHVSAEVSLLLEVPGVRVPFASLLTALQCKTYLCDPTFPAAVHEQLKLLNTGEETVALRALLFWLDRAQSPRHALVLLSALEDLVRRMGYQQERNSSWAATLVSALGASALPRIYMRRLSGHSAELLSGVNACITRILEAASEAVSWNTDLFSSSNQCPLHKVQNGWNSPAVMDLVQRALVAAGEEASLPGANPLPLLGVPALLQLVDTIPAACVPAVSKMSAQLLVAHMDAPDCLSLFGLEISCRLLSRNLTDSILTTLESQRLYSLVLSKLAAAGRTVMIDAIPSWWSSAALTIAGIEGCVLPLSFSCDDAVTLMRIAVSCSSTVQLLQQLVSMSAVFRTIFAAAFHRTLPAVSSKDFPVFAEAQIPAVSAFLRFAVLSEDPAASKSAWQPIVQCYRHFFLGPVCQADHLLLESEMYISQLPRIDCSAEILAAVLRLDPLTSTEANRVLDLISSQVDVCPQQYGHGLLLFQAGSSFLRLQSSGEYVTATCNFAAYTVTTLARLISAPRSGRPIGYVGSCLLVHLEQTVENWLTSWISDHASSFSETEPILKLIGSISELSTAVLSARDVTHLPLLRCLCLSLYDVLLKHTSSDVQAAASELACRMVTVLSADPGIFPTSGSDMSKSSVHLAAPTLSTASLLVTDLPSAVDSYRRCSISIKGELALLIVAVCRLCWGTADTPLGASHLRTRMASAYGATLAIDDRLTLMAIQALDRALSATKTHAQAALQFFWGAAHEDMAIKLPACKDRGSTERLMWTLAQKHPPDVWRCALTVSYASGAQELSKGLLEHNLRHGKDLLDDQVSAAYDARAVVPFVLALVSNYTGDAGQLLFLARHGLLSICIMSLSSTDENLRSLACEAIRLCQEAATDSSFGECRHLTGLLQTVIATGTADVSEPVSVPVHLAVLLAESALIAANADHRLHPRVMKMLSHGVGLSWHDLPFFSSFLLSTTKSSQQELAWMLRYMSVIVRACSESDIYRQRFVAQICMAMGTSTLAYSDALLQQILHVLHGAVKAPESARHFAMHGGGLLWVVDVAKRHMLNEPRSRDLEAIMYCFDIFKEAVQHAHGAEDVMVGARSILGALLHMHTQGRDCVTSAALNSAISACSTAAHACASSTTRANDAQLLELTAEMVQVFFIQRSRFKTELEMKVLDLLLCCRPWLSSHALPRSTVGPLLSWAVDALFYKHVGAVCRGQSTKEKEVTRIKGVITWMTELMTSRRISPSSVMTSDKLCHMLLRMAPLMQSGTSATLHLWLAFVRNMATSSSVGCPWARLTCEAPPAIANDSNTSHPTDLLNVGYPHNKTNIVDCLSTSMVSSGISSEQVAHLILMTEVPGCFGKRSTAQLLKMSLAYAWKMMS